jgi:hypothetical protein
MRTSVPFNSGRSPFIFAAKSIVFERSTGDVPNTHGSQQAVRLSSLGRR